MSASKTLVSRIITVVLAGLLGAQQPAAATLLNAAAVRGFDRYVSLTERRMQGELRPGDAFLWIDGLPPEQRRGDAALLSQGGVVTERLETREGGREIKTPGALLHHWVGTIFIPGASLEQILTVVQDYDRHQQYYAPQVLQSKLLGRNGDDFKVYLRLKQVEVITVILDTEHEVHYTRLDATRAYSRSYSTRCAEVEHAGEKNERALPPEKDHGFLWRIDSFWRFEQRGGGVYIQCEAISLTRDVPVGLGPLIAPFISSIPKQSLEFTLRATRTAFAPKVTAQGSKTGGQP